MTDDIPIGDPIACRDLLFTHSDGKTEAVSVLIGRPVCTDPEQSEWRCPYAIKGPSLDRRHRAIGGDSMQALILCTQSISAELDLLARDRNGKFSYLGESGLHFPEQR